MRIHQRLLTLLTLTALELSAVCSTSRAGVAPGQDRAVQRPAENQLAVHVEEGLLTVALRHVPLDQVLAAVARASGVAVSLDVPAPEPVTVTFTALPLDEGLRRILRTRSFILVFADDPQDHGTQRTPRLTRLRVLGALEAAGVSGRVRQHASVPQTTPPTPPASAAHVSGSDTAAVAPLARVLWEETEGWRRADAAAALGRTWSPDAVDPLSQAVMEDEDPSVRLAAVEALGRTWEEGAVDPLALALLGDPDISVREEAAGALGETWSDAAVGPLVEALLEDPHWQVRDRAAQALGETGSGDAIPPLTQALNDDDSSVRESAALALAALRSSR